MLPPPCLDLLCKFRQGGLNSPYYTVCFSTGVNFPFDPLLTQVSKKSPCSCKAAPPLTACNSGKGEITGVSLNVVRLKLRTIAKNINIFRICIHTITLLARYFCYHSFLYQNTENFINSVRNNINNFPNRVR